jgi:hypothetical protein
MARPWSAGCYGVARQREGSRQNSIGYPAFTLSITLSAREGAAGQAGVCQLLRGSSPTRGVAPKQHRGLVRTKFSPPFFSTVSNRDLKTGFVYERCVRTLTIEVFRLCSRPRVAICRRARRAATLLIVAPCNNQWFQCPVDDVSSANCRECLWL